VPQPAARKDALETKTKRARIADVAKEAGVSKTAVSFAFNSPERLNADTAARIREVADSLGYRPHPVARMLAQKNTMTIGLLSPQVLSVAFANPFFPTLIGGVGDVADQAGYGMLFVSPLHGSLVRALGRATIDGFVVMALSEDHPEAEQIRRSGMPMVIIDGYAFPEHGSVDSKDEVGARAAARHLLALGHREFAVVGLEPPCMPDTFEQGPAPTETVVLRRLQGYRQGLEMGGIQLPDERVVVGPVTFDGGVAAFHQIWEDGLRPTAILAMSDVMAIGVISAARELGLEVPRDLSVVGFDDLEIAAYANPPLTTIHQPIAQKGEEAARLLLRMIEKPDERPSHKTLDTRFIIRASTGPAPGRRRATLADEQVAASPVAGGVAGATGAAAR
jgi:alanine racemase